MKFIKRDPTLGYLDNMLHVPKTEVNAEGVKHALTFFITDRQGGTRCIELYNELENHLAVPRAFWEPEEMPFEVVDCRPTKFPRTGITSRIVLDLKDPNKTTQKDAVAAIMASQGGILQLACGIGKTVVALEVAARMGVPTLVLVNNNNLMKQWADEIERHLDVPGGVGTIQGGTFDWKKGVVLSTYQTMSNRAEDIDEEVRRWFGLAILDEGHHAAAPWFCRTVPLIYGTRLILTATPERNDGAQVVYNFHVGKVLFKDLQQELTPKFRFIWTGLSLDMDKPGIRKAVVDKTGELHLSKLAGYFGQWPERLNKILARVREHEAAGRKIMVLSNSVAECINLLTLYNGESDLYTDISEPTPAEFKSTLEPKKLAKKARARLELELKRAQAALYDKNLNATKKETIKKKLIPHVNEKLAQDDLAKKLLGEMNKRQKNFVNAAVGKRSTAGLMVRKVPTELRMKMLKTKRVIFAIYYYGIEGLDDADLDTVIACEPMTSKGSVQQFTGRILRKKTHKKEPLVEFMEDDIGPIIGMCKIIRQHLRSWPTDEGGPYMYELVDHPVIARRLQWKKAKGLRIGPSSFQATPSM